MGGVESPGKVPAESARQCQARGGKSTADSFDDGFLIALLEVLLLSFVTVSFEVVARIEGEMLSDIDKGERLIRRTGLRPLAVARDEKAGFVFVFLAPAREGQVPCNLFDGACTLQVE